ncbi:DUF6359 domain-containing protein [Micromonospora chersina]|uniref:DUF6359 domain-containing protein n=1 Tax=Micromonospora chersina TaxID=47854 RepID=UPI0033F2BE82
MNIKSVTRSRPGRLIAAIVLAVTVVTPVVVTGTASAATTLTVAQALAAQDGRNATVTGYVIGQPTASSTVITANYTADTAIAIADAATETATAG